MLNYHNIELTKKRAEQNAQIKLFKVINLFGYFLKINKKFDKSCDDTL